MNVKTVQTCSWSNGNAFSWNIHHTVSISLLKTLQLFQHDTFFSIYFFFLPMYFSIKFFNVTIFFYKTSAGPGVSDFLTDKAIVLYICSFIIYMILVYLFNICDLTNPWNSMEKKVITQNVLHSWHSLQHISITIFSGKRYFNDICEYKHIIITHCYYQ